MSDTRQAPFEGSFRVTALHPRPKAARFYGEFDKETVRDEPEFIRYLRTVTPELELQHLQF